MPRTTVQTGAVRGRTRSAAAPRRAARRHAPQRLPRWPLAATLAYGLAVGVSSLAWAVAVRQLMPPAALAAGPWLRWPVLPLVATAVALVATAGFALALRLQVGPRSRRGPGTLRACAWAWLAGAAFPWFSGLLLPAWVAASGERAGAAVNGPVWLLWVWCFVGSMIAAAGVHRVLARAPQQETS